MSRKNRTILTIFIAIILLAAAILVWANQTHRITIWGSTHGLCADPSATWCEGSISSQHCCPAYSHCNTSGGCDPDNNGGGGGGTGGGSSTCGLTVLSPALPITIKQGNSVHITWYGTDRCWKDGETIEGFGIGDDGSYTSLNIASNNSQSFNPTPNVSTTYKLVSGMDGGPIVYTAKVTVTPIEKPTVSFASKNISVTKGSSVTLAWNSTNATSATIDQSVGSVSPSGSKVITPTQLGTTVYTITASGPGGTAVDQAIVTVNQTADTTSPSIPTNLTANAVACSTINLNWTASTDDRTPQNQIIYEIYNADTNIMINTSSTTSYAITGTSCNITYRYYVKARDNASPSNISDKSNTASVTPSGGSVVDTQAPGKPTNLAITAVNCNQIDLSWKAPADNDVSGYDIFNASDSKLITSTKETNYSFKFLTENKAYSYYIKAHDASGNVSEASSTGNISTPVCSTGQGNINTNGNTSTTTTNPLINLKTLISTGQSLWFNLLIAFIIAGVIGFLLLRKKE